MTAGRDVGPVEREDPRRATFLELFFDLVYVFVLAELVSREVRRLELQHGATGLNQLTFESGKLVLLLLAMWFIWWHTAWTTSRYDPLLPQVQIIVILAVIGSLIMALALTRAFSGYGYVFATAYVATHLARAAILMSTLHGERRQLKARMLGYYCAVAPLWLAGATFAGWARGILWLSALAIEFAGSQFDWPIPRLRRSSSEESVIAGEHLGERYQQFFLIALGESILGAGLTLTAVGFRSGPMLAFTVTVITTILLWRIYFQRAGLILAEAIAAAPRPHKMGQAVAGTQFVMIAGVVVTSIGYQALLFLPYERSAVWLLIVIGPALFLAARTRFEYEVFGRVARSRFVALAALAATAAAAYRAPQLLGATAVAAVLAGVAIVDTVRARARRHEQPAFPETARWGRSPRRGA